MPSKQNTRRDFLKASALITTELGLGGTPAFSSTEIKPKNSLPMWRGFNLLDFFSPDPDQGRKNKPEYLKSGLESGNLWAALES